MVIFFDIDGTLLDTCGAGHDALVRALAESAGVAAESLPEIDLAGAVDSGVLESLITSLGAGNHLSPADLFPRYVELLRENLGSARFRPSLLPGAGELVRLCAGEPGLASALVTGNIRQGAQAKLDHFGLWEMFDFGGFGDDAPDRPGVTRAAVRRAREAGCAGDVSTWWIVGDTPKDIACARELGMRVAAVATGTVSLKQLDAHRPDLLFEDLRDPCGVLSRIRDSSS